jgi:hypothetical protein
LAKRRLKATASPHCGLIWEYGSPRLEEKIVVDAVNKAPSATDLIMEHVEDLNQALLHTNQIYADYNATLKTLLAQANQQVATLSIQLSAAMQALNNNSTPQSTAVDKVAPAAQPVAAPSTVEASTVAAPAPAPAPEPGVITAADVQARIQDLLNSATGNPAPGITKSYGTSA